MHDDDLDPFDSELFDYQVVAPKTDADLRAVHAEPLAKGARCQECALYGCGRGPIASSPPVGNPKLLVIGESPGPQDILEGQHFFGKPGEILDQGLMIGELDRSDVVFSNAVLCQPHLPLRDFQSKLSKNLLPGIRGLDPVHACAPRLQAELAEYRRLGVDVILPIGGVALQTVAEIHGLKYGSGKALRGIPTVATIKNQHGAPIDLSDRIDPKTGKSGPIIVAALHPQFGLKGNRVYLQVIREDIAKACRIAKRGYVDWKLPPSITISQDGDAYSADHWIRIIDWVTENADTVTIDIETDGIKVNKCRIRCIGVYAKTATPNPFTHDTELAFVIPLIRRNGSSWWSSDDFDQIRVACCRMIDKKIVVGHNVVNFDLTVLYRHGFHSNRDKRALDTMIAHHCSIEAELPHSLSFLMRRLFEAPMHKHDVDHKGSDDGETDFDLHYYCVSDIVVTGRAWPFMEQWVHNAGNVTAFGVDTKLSPIASRAGYDIGLFVDERRRGELSLQFNRLCQIFREDFSQRAEEVQRRYRDNITPFEVSPASPKRVSELLWGVLNLRPTLTTKNIAWEEGEDASTSVPALLALLDSGQIEDPKVLDLVESLIRFRSCDKVRSTYLDNLRTDHDPKLAYLGTTEPIILDGREILPRRSLLSRIFITWKLQTVPSGRWASSPNAQNIPARAFAPVLLDGNGNILRDAHGKILRADALNLRRLFVAPPGHKIIGSDLQAIENRIYAAEAQDQFLLKAYTSVAPDGKPFDVHTLNAATLFIPKRNWSWDELLSFYMDLVKMKKTDPSRYKFIRTVAKIDAYGAVYGVEMEKFFVLFSTMRDKATGERTFPNIEKRETDHFFQTWHRLHPETRQLSNQARIEAQTLGYASEPLHHRKRWFRDGASKINAILNHRIQGMTAAKMNEATLRIVDDIPFQLWSPYSGMCLQVHDYIGVFAPEDKAEFCKERIEHHLYSEYKGLPLPGDTALITDDWAQQG